MKIKTILFSTISVLSTANFSLYCESSYDASTRDNLTILKQADENDTQSPSDHLTKKDLIDFINDARKEHSKLLKMVI